MKSVGGHHTVDVLIDNDGLTVNFTCHEDVDGPCRWTCAKGCEIWDEECFRDHPRERIDYCNALEFINNDEAEWYEKYCGMPNAEFRSGPIELIWQPGIDTYHWRYRDDF